MITANDCLKKYGNPTLEKHMTIFQPIDSLVKGSNGVIPKKIYCNIDLIHPLQQVLSNLASEGLLTELKTWNGCFNIRKTTGGSSFSLHSWGVAIDINAATNAYNKKPTLSKEFVACFKRAGFDWGGDWKVPDGMHFQLSKI